MVHESLKKIKRVIISIGHDKISVGAQNKKGDKENTLAGIIAINTANYLRANGLVVWLMPDYTLADTIKYLNIQGNRYTDLAIEIHKDSFGTLYNEAKMHRRCGFYFASENAGAKTIAKAMIDVFIREGAHPTSWVRPDTDSNHGRLGFCSKTKMIAMIAELGFIEGDNSNDENQWYAWALTKSILTVLEMPIRAIPINYTTIKPIL